MTAFINNYQLHILAAKEKILTGGEYLDCKEEDVPEIKRLLEETEDKFSSLLKLSDAIEELEELLRNHKSGETISPLYPLVPSPLRGYVELFLDTEHRASYRLIEPLIYQSDYYLTSLQSLSFGLLSRVKERPFVLSTPRLVDQNHVQISLDFCHEIVDSIFQTREKPISEVERNKMIAEVNPTGGLALEDLFTDLPPQVQHQPVEHGIRLTYTGHAGFLIETSDVSILIDPVIASRCEGAEEMLSFSEIPPSIHYVCLTHNHQDHINLETLLQLRYKIETVLDNNRP